MVDTAPLLVLAYALVGVAALTLGLALVGVAELVRPRGSARPTAAVAGAVRRELAASL